MVVAVSSPVRSAEHAGSFSLAMDEEAVTPAGMDTEAQSIAGDALEEHCARIRLAMEAMVQEELIRENYLDHAGMRLKLRLWFDTLPADLNNWEIQPPFIPIQSAWHGIMRQLSYDEWLNLIIDTQRALYQNAVQNARAKEPSHLYSFPCWELCEANTVPSFEQLAALKLRLGHAPETKRGWAARWVKAGGTVHDGHLIAPVGDAVWTALGSSKNFRDALDTDTPPFALGSKRWWRAVSRVECARLGVPFPGSRGAEEIIRNAGYRTMEEILAASAEQRKATWKANAAVDAYLLEEKDKMFRLMEQVETMLIDPADLEGWEFLSKSLAQLTATEYFENYPNWRAKAWKLIADMRATLKDAAGELECLQAAITLNPKLAVKRRIKALVKSCGIL